MKKLTLTPEYYFVATHCENYAEIFELKLIGFNPNEFKIGQVERVPPEILRLTSWPSLQFTTQTNEILGAPENEDRVSEQIFYVQRGDMLYGEDIVTNRAILGKIYGSLDENSISKSVILGLRVSQVRFNNINLFNYPTAFDAKDWEAALSTKWRLSNHIAA
ncbi:hypothetical protein HDF19_13210 [Mucilaginibacter sp. E4BP6]|uniref:hypothetical protein n=1 Tax=Mucilaginibacter sp. E4BP6 TaxID=2723089 RepID=UPI0015CD197D|nr:hypothetical protein [Mucilaginibacter sp. E4BP6]NYE64863.1 hypothetical protein [Mucilaginibacter sp. E4BP6]